MKSPITAEKVRALTFWLFLGMLLVLCRIIQQEAAAFHDQAKKQGETALALSSLDGA